VKVANPNATQEEIADAVETGGKNIFVDQVVIARYTVDS